MPARVTESQQSIRRYREGRAATPNRVRYQNRLSGEFARIRVEWPSEELAVGGVQQPPSAFRVGGVARRRLIQRAQVAAHFSIQGCQHGAPLLAYAVVDEVLAIRQHVGRALPGFAAGSIEIEQRSRLSAERRNQLKG